MKLDMSNLKFGAFRNKTSSDSAEILKLSNIVKSKITLPMGKIYQWVDNIDLSNEKLKRKIDENT
jgi:hypothetical protein